MRSRVLQAALFTGVLFLTAACATSEQWSDWRGHTTHFASGDHAMFSFRNNLDGSNPRVSRADIEKDRTEKWWGKVITVQPGQIFQN
ncbi:MAG TPA: hypothetical protein VFN71_01250 [Methylomirabilota bacterium]|nr:hypothetical protein [Methylomirabilota bacterium]